MCICSIVKSETHNQLGSCNNPIKEVQWLMWTYRNKLNQSEIIRNGSSVQLSLSKHQKYVRRLTRMQLTSWLQQRHAMLCIQSASLRASVQCANVYLEQRMMNNDFHAKIVEQWFIDLQIFTYITYLHAALAEAGPEARILFFCFPYVKVTSPFETVMNMADVFLFFLFLTLKYIFVC